MTTPVAPVPAPAAPAAAPGKAPVVPTNGIAKPPAGKAPVTAGGAPPAPEAPVETRIKLKVDGKVEEMTQAELEKWASKGRYSDKTTQEAREAIKRAMAAEKELAAREASAKEKAQKDTDAWMREHGIDPDDFAKRRLERKVEEGRMTAEQKRAAELEQENKRLKEAQETKDKEYQAEQQKQVVSQLQKRIETELLNAVKRAGMTVGDESFYAVYESFREAYELGILPVDSTGLQPHHADRIVEDAQEKLNATQKNLRENALKLRGAALLDFIGKEAVDNIVAARLEEIRAARGLASPKPAEPQRAPAPRPSGYLSPAEAEAQLKALQRRT